jgi:hypothetical protein
MQCNDHAIEIIQSRDGESVYGTVLYVSEQREIVLPNNFNNFLPDQHQKFGSWRKNSAPKNKRNRLYS